MAPHSWDQFSNGLPIVGDLPEPVEDRVGSVELVIETLEVEALGDLLGWQDALVGDQDIAFLVKVSASNVDLLSLVGELLVAKTSEEGDGQANESGDSALQNGQYVELNS